VCHWRRHIVHVDHHRYNQINRYHIERHIRPRLTEDIWRHDPYHRRGVAYPTPVTRERFQPGQARQPKARREFRGFERPAAPRVERAPAPPPPAARPPAPPPPAARPPARRAPVARPPAPVFEGFGTPRSDVRAHEERGRESRRSMIPSVGPKRVAPPRGAAPGRGTRPSGRGAAPPPGGVRR
jgi:hypothetical protein